MPFNSPTTIYVPVLVPPVIDREAITTGAAPVAAGRLIDLTVITSGGTGGVEYVDLLDLEDLNGDPAAFDPELQGQRHTFYLEDQVDPGDVVTIRTKQFGGAHNEYPTPFIDEMGRQVGLISTANGGVVLNYPAACITFEWLTYLGWTFALAPGVNATVNTDGPLLQYVAGVGPSNVGAVLTSFGSGSTFVPRVGAEGGTNPTTHHFKPEAADICQLSSADVGQTIVIDLPVVSAGAIPSLGQRIWVYGFQGALSGVVNIDPTNIRTLAGGAVTSIAVDHLQWLLLEVWDETTWRILRGTAAVT